MTRVIAISPRSGPALCNEEVYTQLRSRDLLFLSATMHTTSALTYAPIEVLSKPLNCRMARVITISPHSGHVICNEEVYTSLRSRYLKFLPITMHTTSALNYALIEVLSEPLNRRMTRVILISPHNGHVIYNEEACTPLRSRDLKFLFVTIYE